MNDETKSEGTTYAVHPRELVSAEPELEDVDELQYGIRIRLGESVGASVSIEQAKALRGYLLAAIRYANSLVNRAVLDRTRQAQRERLQKRG